MTAPDTPTFKDGVDVTLRRHILAAAGDVAHAQQHGIVGQLSRTFVCRAGGEPVAIVHQPPAPGTYGGDTAPTYFARIDGCQQFDGQLQSIVALLESLGYQELRAYSAGIIIAQLPPVPPPSPAGKV